MSRIGEQFGEYRLTHRIGSGGTAEVYRGEHVEHPLRIVAVKILKTDIDDETGKKTFQHEVRVHARLDHPHIIKILGFGVQETKPYIIMEYASEGNLAQRYATGQPVPHEQMLQWVHQIAEALQHAHTHGIVHCDLKPQNLFLCADGSVKIGDFGYARILQSTYQHSSTPEGVTWEYSAPEQIDSELFGGPSPLTDQYALGIIVYQWLCGLLPFRRPMPELMYQHLDEAPLPLRWVGVSARVDRVVLKAIAKIPRGRYKDITLFAQALEKAGKPKETTVSFLRKKLRRILLGGLASVLAGGNAIIIGTLVIFSIIPVYTVSFAAAAIGFVIFNVCVSGFAVVVGDIDTIVFVYSATIAVFAMYVSFYSSNSGNVVVVGIAGVVAGVASVVAGVAVIHYRKREASPVISSTSEERDREVHQHKDR